jgi:sialate O-acetylesterase
MRAYKTVKNTGIAVISDCGEFNEIHPIKYPLAKDFVCRQKSFSTAWT